MRRHAETVLVMLAMGAAAAPQELVFEPPVTTFAEPNDAINQGLLVGDLDEDGLPDVLYVAGAFEFDLTALLALPGGGFATGPTSPAGATNIGYVLGDFDGDGHLDLAGGGSASPPTVVQLNLGVGDGSFSATLDVPSGAPGGAHLGTAGDVDGDGDLDLVTATPFAELLLGGGDGSFTQAQSIPGPGGFFGFPQAFTLVDIQADGIPDLVVGMLDGDQRVHLGTGTGLDPTAIVVDMGADGFTPGGSHRVADLDGDGIVDLLSSDVFDLVLRFRPGIGGGAFGPLVTSPLPVSGTVGANQGPLVWGDWDGDGVEDVAVALPDRNMVAALRGVGDGTYDHGLAVSTLTAVLRPEAIDADQDGRKDLVAIRKGSAGFGLPTGVAVIRNATYGAGEPYVDLGGALAGTRGFPVLVAEGPLLDGTPFAVRLHNGLPGALPFLVVGLSELAAPFKGGTLWPAGDLITNQPVFDTDGSSTLAGTWVDPVGGYDVWLQAWFADAGAVKGYASTTGVRASVP